MQRKLIIDDCLNGWCLPCQILKGTYTLRRTTVALLELKAPHISLHLASPGQQSSSSTNVIYRDLFCNCFAACLRFQGRSENFNPPTKAMRYRITQAWLLVYEVLVGSVGLWRKCWTPPPVQPLAKRNLSSIPSSSQLQLNQKLRAAASSWAKTQEHRHHGYICAHLMHARQ